ncbi:MAG: hypothetical protein [Caudoviricetes sp.]|nr:MAG: hypothetical protein [Caudoviricetes sp.]
MAFNPDIPEEINILDLLNVFSLWAQVDNMNMDVEQTKYIKKVIQAISKEIEKLHEENDIIMKQNDIIIKMIYNNYLNYGGMHDLYEGYKKLNLNLKE